MIQINPSLRARFLLTAVNFLAAFLAQSGIFPCVKTGGFPYSPEVTNRETTMKNPVALTLLAAALVAAPKLSHAEDTTWESLRVFNLSGGQTVAVAVPSEWSPVEKSKNLGKLPLRFEDASGNVVTIPVAALERASTEKRVFRPDFTQKVARSDR